MALAQRLNCGSARLARAQHRVCRAFTSVPVKCVAQPSQQRTGKSRHDLKKLALLSVGAAAPLLLQVSSALAEALAEEGGHDIVKGTTIALIHPIVMGTLFASTVYAGYLGLQWRRVRTIGDDIKALKAQIPKPTGDEPAPASPLTQQVGALEKERKELAAGGYRDRHNTMGSWLLGAGVVIAIEGALNTYARTGKLFPGPHLFAGAGIVALWALAASLVPAMQKGNDTARSAHIALNTLNLGLFIWQIPTGLEIVGNVFKNTSFP